jgi:small subunit ribosomal protein S16
LNVGKNTKQGLPSHYALLTLATLFRDTPKQHGGWQYISWLAAATGNDRFMAVKIRMKRIGAKNTPVFRIVVADGRSPRDGKCIEELGTYQPLKKGDNYTLKLDRADYWISKGAQPSDTVASFLRKAKKAAAAVA